DKNAPDAKKYTAVPPSTPGSTALLFALPVTIPKTDKELAENKDKPEKLKFVSAITPTNFTLRLEGIVGTPPKPGQPRDPANPLLRDYAAKFEIRAWIADIQNWL